MKMNVKKYRKVFLSHVFPGITVKRTAIALLHSIWLVAVCLLWLGYINFMDGFGFMNDYMNMRSFVNEYILHKEADSKINQSFLLINTSQNNAILPLDNDNTINTVITDRAMLAKKLEILDRNSDKIAFVICDVFFEKSSADPLADSALQAVILNLSKKNKFVMPGYYNHKSGQFQAPVFTGTTGISQYRSSFLNTQFLKYTLIADGYEQMPLTAFETVTGKKLEANKFLFFRYYSAGGIPALNTIIPEFRYTQSDLVDGESYYQLGMFEDYLLGKDQVVIIGDFEGKNDLHYSMAGLNAGPLVLLNAYLSLKNGDHLISVGYVLILLIIFFWISYQHFYNRLVLPDAKTRLRKVWNYILEERVYFVLLALVYISMLFFHHYIHFLILLTYFAAIEFVTKHILNRK